MSFLAETATSLVAKLEAGQLTAVEVNQAFLDQIDQVEPKIHAFLSRTDSQQVLEQAAAVDQRRRDGKPVGKLGGLPIAIKDNLVIQGGVTTCGSKMLENFRSPYSSTVIDKIQAADGIIVGKTNMDEFAMGSSTENSGLATEPTRNPWNLDCVPGGSSGGSVAAVAASMVPLSIGSDTGGSIRQPAAFCGVTGLKPTYGRVSRYGLVAFASSLDQIGPIARTVEDAALLLEVIAGHDPLDSTSIDAPVPAYAKSVTQKPDSFTVGLPKELLEATSNNEMEQIFREAVQTLESLGVTVKEVSLPHFPYAVATYYIIGPCEASSNLARYDGVHYGYRTGRKSMDAELKQEAQQLRDAGREDELESLDTSLVRMYRRTRDEGFGFEVKRRIMLGTHALSSGYKDAYYLKALQTRRLIAEDYRKAFQEVDLLIGPCTPEPAFKIGEKINDPLAMYLEDLYTVSTNLTGVAGIAVPCGFTQAGLPVGLHLQSPSLGEERLLQAAYLYQHGTEWHQQKPQLSNGGSN